MPDGTNVNFVELQNNGKIFVRTYERGVENETLSCGTGVTASALATGRNNKKGKVDIITLGGNLTVSFEQIQEGVFKNTFHSLSQSQRFTISHQIWSTCNFRIKTLV